MPMSSSEGKQWVHDRIAALADTGRLSVLDVGPGVGTYAKLLRDLDLASIVGLEVWAPYAQTYRLNDYYDDIVIGDVRTTDLPAADVIILGDVIEHMSRDEALAVWDRCTSAAQRAIYLSIPIVHYPQDEIEDNPYEVHVVDDWSHDAVIETFAGIGTFELGAEVGVYERLTG